MIHHLIQGERVPALGFGTYRTHGTDTVKSVSDALALGYRHLDTAQSYDNEEQVGAGITAAGVPRSEIFLVSKVRPSNYPRGLAAVSVQQSLKRLGTDYVDLMLLHWPNDEVPLEEPLSELAELQQQGAVRHVGVSNFPPSWVERANTVTRIFCNQVEYHPYLSQDGLLDQAEELDLLITAYRPFANGLVLTDDLLLDIAVRHGKTAAQVTLRWLVQQPRVATIPKSASHERRAENLDIFGFELSGEEMAAIHGLSRNHRIIGADKGLDWER